MGIIDKCQKRFFKPISKLKPNKQKTKAQKGQLVIEYVLLLTVVTVLATSVIRLLIGQGATQDEQGLVVQKWSVIVNAISADMIDN
jgi:uncharacterized protein (UPF0333 family)